MSDVAALEGWLSKFEDWRTSTAVGKSSENEQRLGGRQEAA